MDTEMKAVQRHKTKISEEEDAGIGMRQWRSSTGKKVGFQYAEAFKVIRLG